MRRTGIARIAIAGMAMSLSSCATPSPWRSELVTTNAAGTDSPNHDDAPVQPPGSGLRLRQRQRHLGLAGVQPRRHEAAVLQRGREPRPGDGNGADDVFVRDLDAGTTIAVSTSAAGTATGNGWSQGSVFSPNGAKVAFQSIASNLGPTDPGTTADVYVRDLTTGAVTLVSVNAAGTGGGNGGSTFPRFSPDGTKIAFLTTASNLGPNDTNGFEDVYVRDLVAGATTLVSVNGAGTNAGNRDSLVGEFSPDGTKVLFGSRASDLGPTDTDSVPGCDYPSCRDVYERDLVTGRTTLVSANADGSDSGNADSLGGTYNADGSLVLFSSLADDLGPDDTNGHWDLYVAAVTSEG